MTRVVTDVRWWKADKVDVAGALWGYRQRLEERQQDTRRIQLQNARLYGNSKLFSLTPNSYSRQTDDTAMRLNVIAACVDALVSKISQSRPAPQFLTSGADYKLRRKTAKLNKFGKGMLHQSATYRIAPSVLRDGLVFGTGIEKLYSVGKRIVGERVFPWELIVDLQEAFYGNPRTWVQRKYVDRDVLLERFGGGPQSKARRAILNAKPSEFDDIGRDPTSDQLLVLEAWRLPTAEDTSDGRHVIAIDGYAFLDEEWSRPRAPFAVFKWDEPLAGWWGRGVADALTPIQYEINVLLRKIQRAFALLGVPRILLDASSGVPVAHMNNDIGAILQYRAGTTPPTIVAPQTIHPEIFGHLTWLYQRAFEIVGVSQMSVAAAKPAGLDSGEALREYGDQTSERFVAAMRRWEDFHMDVVRIGLDEVREIPGFVVDVPDRDQKIELAWKDVNLADSAYVLQCFPEALLPQQPAGRQQRIEELVASGFLTKEVAMELMTFPDMEEATASVTAPRTSIRQRIDRMLDGEYISPEPFDVAAGPQSPAITMVLAAYLEERERGCPDDVLQLLRDWMQECSALLQPTEPAGMPQQATANAQVQQGAPMTTPLQQLAA